MSACGSTVYYDWIDGSVCACSTATGSSPFLGHEGLVLCVASDGQQLVPGSTDGTVRPSQVHTGDAVQAQLRGHEDIMSRAAVIPYGRQVKLASDALTLHIGKV